VRFANEHLNTGKDAAEGDHRCSALGGCGHSKRTMRFPHHNRHGT
jgi:hypothetical protein